MPSRLVFKGVPIYTGSNTYRSPEGDAIIGTRRDGSWVTDSELTALVEAGGELAIPYLDGAPVRVHNINELSPVEVLPALRGFLGLTPKQRRADGRHLIAYCTSTVEAVGPEVLEDMGSGIPTLETVWDHVQAGGIFFSKLDAGKYASTPAVFVELEGNVAWEPEHGLQMSWADGTRLVKVGAFDGHPTNGHAAANPDRDQFVFYCDLPELCTGPDPN